MYRFTRSLSLSPRFLAEGTTLTPSSCARSERVRITNFADPPIAWLSRRQRFEKAPIIVKDVLGGDSLLADAALGEGDVLGR